MTENAILGRKLMEESSKKYEKLYEKLHNRREMLVEQGKSGSDEEKDVRLLMNAVRKQIFTEHNPNGTMHICPNCQQKMYEEHLAYCVNCGQLVR